MPLATELFDYELPPECVALDPAAKRDGSRLLVVDRAGGAITHATFADLPRFLRAGDVLFRNIATVIPARLSAVRPSGGRVECLLVESVGNPAVRGTGEVWRCLVKPGRRLPIGAGFAHPDAAFIGEVIAREPDGAVLVRFAIRDGESVVSMARRFGEVPLPPYLGPRRADQKDADRVRYQTVYADPARPVASAAPTAGLHFTAELLSSVAAAGVHLRDLTLNVGLGTFQPISSEVVEGHPIHREHYELPVDSQCALFPPLAGRRIAVGTTAVRAIEDFLASHSGPLDRTHFAEAGIYLYPPSRFRGVDALITNFHQPRSTLLCMVSAFLTPGSTDGIGWMKRIYAEAIGLRYRFFSYGDAMLIL
jgi:S-adenosylmethionine:tRNA ribosyltransferase-isomerase